MADTSMKRGNWDTDTEAHREYHGDGGIRDQVMQKLGLLSLERWRNSFSFKERHGL